MLYFFQVQQMSTSLKRSNNHIIRFPYEQTANHRCVSNKFAIIAHRAIIRQPVFLANKIVVQAMCRSGMYQARTRFQCYMITTNNIDTTFIKRVM